MQIQRAEKRFPGLQCSFFPNVEHGVKILGNVLKFSAPRQKSPPADLWRAALVLGWVRFGSVPCCLACESDALQTWVRNHPLEVCKKHVGCGTSGRGLMVMVVLGWWLDVVILEVFSCQNHSVVPQGLVKWRKITVLTLLIRHNCPKVHCVIRSRAVWFVSMQHF